MKEPLQLELPFDDHAQTGEISDAALYDLFFANDFRELDTDPSWQGPGPNFLAEFRGDITAEEYDALLDEAVEALKRAIDDVTREQGPPPKTSLEE